MNIDLLQNITSSNNSGTSTTNRWTSNSGSHNVDFTISGHALANVSLLSGPRYAALATPAANTALALIKPPLITAIDAVLVPLVNGTGGILDLLLNTSALGDTSITIPTKITAPTTIASNIDAKFVGSVAQTNLLDVNILSGADGIFYVYLAGDVNLTLVAPTGNLSATPRQLER